MNTITIIGRLTAEPVLKTIARKSDGEERQLCEFTVASDRGNNRGADFFSVNVWFNAAQHERHLIKGQRIAITGRMEQQQWTDTDDNRRERWIVIAAETEWLDKPKGARTTTNDANGSVPPVDEVPVEAYGNEAF